MGLVTAEADRRLASGDTDIGEILSAEWGENALKQISPAFADESSAHLGLLEHLRAQHAEQIDAPGAGELASVGENGGDSTTRSIGGPGHGKYGI